MDRREWDYGARLPRDRRVSETYSPQDGPESTEKSSWGTGSVADTGSLEPSPEAIAWARRADAWAQQPAAEQGGQLEPVSRWSDVAPTGSQTTYSADGVGWRTETAEWLAAEQTARWRQTTEWRSVSGDHGWRSTTEAWQTGGNADGLRPPADPQTRQQLAISGTAWPTPDDPQVLDPDGTPQAGSWQQQAAEGRPAWQQFAAPTPPWQQGTANAQPWQQGTANASAPPWQQGTASAGAQPWQQGTASASTPPWQQGAASTGAQPWQPGAAGTPPWQQQGDAQQSGPPAQRAGESSPAWQQLVDPTPGRQQAPVQQPGTTPPPRPPTWQNPVSAAPSWQDPVSATPSWQTPPDDPPSWQTPAASATPSWQTPAAPATPSWSTPAAPGRPYPGSRSGGLDDGSHLVREDDRDRWRREAATGMPGVGERSVGRRRAPDAGIPGPSEGTSWSGFTEPGRAAVPQMPAIADRPNRPDTPSRSDAPSWRDRPETPDWRDRADAPGRPARAEAPDWRERPDSPGRRNGAEPPAWQGRTEVPSRRNGTAAPDWRDGDPDWRDGPGGPRRPDDRRDEPSTDWRSRTEAPDWRNRTEAPDRRDRSDAPGWRDAPVRRQLEAAPDRREPGDAPVRRQLGAAPDWRERGDVPDRRQLGAAPERRDRGEPPDWRDRTEAPDWRDRTDAPSRRRNDDRRDDDRRDDWRDDDPRPRDRRDDDRRDDRRDGPPGDWRDRSDGWRSEPDSGSWSRGDERRDGWRRGDDTDDDTGDPGWRDAGPSTNGWRRDARPAADPWAHNVSDTGMIPMSWEQPASDTGSWRAPEDGGPRRGQGAESPVDPAMWRADGVAQRQDANWPSDDRPADWRAQIRQEDGLAQPSDAVTEIRQRIDPDTWHRANEPADWQREERERAARGSAPYRAGDTGDWRQGLAAAAAAEDDLEDGESRRFGTQDFVPFRPSASTSVPTSAPAGAAAPRSASPAAPTSAPAQAYPPQGRPATNGRENLLVPADETNGARWQDPPDTEWPPRGAATGSYERRAVGSGRSNLLEPENNDVERGNGGPLAAVGYTVIWYGVPVVLFVLYMLVLNGSQQSHALSTLAGAAPQFGLSLVLSLVVAVGLRWASSSWKAASVGLAAAVLGGGLATVLTSAITGNSLS